MSHAKQEANGHVPEPVQGITITDSDVLEPDAPRQGGLFVRREFVCTMALRVRALLTTFKQHTFRAPAKPIEPPTPRTSILGLDKLAKEKRLAAAALESDARKRSRNDDEPIFKGTLYEQLYMWSNGLGLCAVPNQPASRMQHSRQRGEETPSHPGGLSESARQRLEEFRKKRDKQRGK